MKTYLVLFSILTGLTCSALAQIPRLVAPVGHFYTVSSAVFSPDGKMVLAGCIRDLV